MSDLDRNYASPFGRAAGRIDAATVDAGLRAYMLRIYNYMSIGLAITGLAALGVYMAAVTSDPSGATAKIGNAFLTPGSIPVAASNIHAGVAELADAHDSKSCSSGVPVRPRPPVSPIAKDCYYKKASHLIV
jgi:hypothetical protein